MKIVRDINKLIMKEVLEIVFLLAFVFVATSLWTSSNAGYLSATVSAYGSLNYTSMQIENPIKYEMFPMQNKIALEKLSPCVITVSNETYTEESYILTMQIDKSSTLDYRVLNLAIDGVVYPLVDLPLLEENNCYTFILDENTLKGAEKKYKIQLWMDASTGNEMQSKSLLMSFELMNGVTKM